MNKLSDPLVSKGVQQRIAMSGFPENASTHAHVKEMAKQVYKFKQDLQAKNKVWNDF